MMVSRWCLPDPVTQRASGDYLTVGDYNLGAFRDLVDAEYRRAGSAFKMRPMWFTGSSHWRAIMRLAIAVRGIAAVRASRMSAHPVFIAATVASRLFGGGGVQEQRKRAVGAENGAT